MHRHGITPNLAARKTEIILSFRGPGAQKAKTQYYGPAAAKSLHLAGEYGSHKVRLVTQYAHLGGALHHRRVEIFRCIVLSKLLYGTESWVIIEDAKTATSAMRIARMPLFYMLLAFPAHLNCSGSKGFVTSVLCMGVLLWLIGAF